MRTILTLLLTTLFALILLATYWKGYADARAAQLRSFPDFCGESR